MTLTKEQKKLLRIAIAEAENILKNSDGMDAKGIAWELYFSYDAIGQVYAQITAEAAGKETK